MIFFPKEDNSIATDIETCNTCSHLNNFDQKIILTVIFFLKIYFFDIFLIFTQDFLNKSRFPNHIFLIKINIDNCLAFSVSLRVSV